MKRKVVLGMSGGVDSSVAALLLKNQGYEVYGYFMRAGDGKNKGWISSINWKEDENFVRNVCKKIGVKKLFVVDCEEGYEKNILHKLFEDYSIGLTPNPDILCNNVGKFPGLIKVADKIGAQWIATGHYARIKHNDGGSSLFRGKDREKDQSYFLVGLPQKILSRCLFPVGELKKTEVREIARKSGFSNWDKRSSRGICYLGKIDVKEFLHSRIKEKKGNVVDPQGNIIGSHVGMMFFTIGEKVGDKNGFVINKEYRRKNKNAKLFVAAKKEGNVLVVAPEGHEILKTKKLKVENMHFANDEEVGVMKGRIRHLGELNPGRLKKEKGNWIFEFDKGVEGVAEGQFLVVYKGEKLVGGGEIRLI